MVVGSGWSGDLLEGNERWNEASVGKLKGMHPSLGQTELNELIKNREGQCVA